MMQAKYKQLYFILIATLTMMTSLYIVEQVLALNYLLKTGIKIGLFLSVSLLYIKIFNVNYIKTSFKNYQWKGKPTKVHLLGISLIILMVVAFFIFKSFINMDAMMADFTQKYGINRLNIFGYGLYIIIGNAFMEELFFRGFIFLNMRQAGFRKSAYGLSSLAFSIYHISIFQSWFSIGVFLLALFGLTIGGLIFAYLDDKANTFLDSWFVHMCADIGIIIIGILIVYGLV